MVGISLGALDGFIICTGEVYLVLLSLGLPLGSPLGSPNLVLNRIILGMPLVNTLGSLLNSILDINWCGPWLGT